MKLLLIAKSNMKKKKSNVVILFILVIIATMLLYTSLSVLTEMNTFLVEKNESQNGAHNLLITGENYSDEISSVFKSIEGFESLEIEDCVIFVSASVQNIDREEKATSTALVMYNLEKDRMISDLVVIDEGEELKENSIVLPAYLKVAKDYKTGDSIDIVSDGKTYTFEIYGFTEDVIFSTPSNISVYKSFISSQRFVAYYDNKEVGVRQQNYSVRLEEGANTTNYSDAVSKALTQAIIDPNFSVSVFVDFDTMCFGTSMFINILMAVCSIFAFLIIAISIIVIRFSIVTTIENNMTNIGTLEALGYTSKQLRNATIIEFLSISMAGIFTGLLVSGISANFIAKVVSASIGLLWKTTPNLFMGGISILIILGLIIVATFISSGKYKKISTLDALRNGIGTHNFKKNNLPLQKSKFGLNTTVGLKEIFNNKKQNISILVIVSLLSFTCVLVVSMYYNFVYDTKALVQIVGVEKANVIVSSKDAFTGKDVGDSYEIFEEISTMSQVNLGLRYSNYNVTVSKGDKEISIMADICENTDLLTVDTVIEGRRPTYDNEIMITNVVAKKIGASLGELITVQANDKEEEYLVVGISQQISNLGRSSLLTEQGITRLDDTFRGNTLYVYLDNDITAKEFITILQTKYSDKNLEISNFDENYDAILSSFVGSLKILCVVFVVITILVIVLILYMIIKMKLLKDRKMLGVYKAIGFTTGQLIWQTATSFALVTSLGGLIGVILGKFFINAAFAAMLSKAGIESSNLTITMPILLSIFGMITALAYLVSIITSMKIRKIEPYKMIVE